MPNNNRVSRWINNRFSREQEEEGSSTQDEGGDQGSGAHQGPARSSDGDAPSVEVRGSNEIEEEGAASEIKDHNRSPSKVSPSKNVTGEVDKKERLDAADRSNGSEVPSHPVTPSPDKTRRSVSTPVVSNGKANGESNDIQSHLRKVTANLVDMLDTMSNSTQTTPAGSSQDGFVPRRHTLGSRGDSVATMLDLEAAGNSTNDEVVPAHHVRRLTSTMVDILRAMTGNSANNPVSNGRQGDNEAVMEAHALIGESGSEISMETNSERLTYGSGSSNRDSEISASTALLRAQYLPQPDYRGDEVRPFYMDRPESFMSSKLKSSAIPSSESSEDGDHGDQEQHQENGNVDGKREYSSEVQKETEELDASCPIPKKLKKNTRINWIGLSIFVLFCCALVMYVGIRAAKTLGLGGSLWYGVVVLCVEILGGLAMLPYGVCLTKRVDDPVPPAIEAANKGQSATTILNYHVRIVIPCYKEPLEVISKTFMAAMYATLPANCRRTVYLLDDGRYADKRRFVRSLGMPNAVYISGRKREKKEMNGKSANINNAMRQIYPDGVAIPLDEVICVFDADQVPNADFFSKTVPLLDGGQDVAMVLSPQTFFNLNPDGDIFNHANVHFWDYTQPGYDALGLISCTGTNFLLRARAFSESGWFPEWTLTEDFALGIELKRRGWQCRYVDEYLAVGEAPDEVRNCFQQRSRWAKGHFQVFFGRGRNPAFGRGAKGLSLLMRWMYGSVILSYFSAFLATPLLMLVPIITVWFGAFPIVINFWAALSITIYYGATTALMYYTRAFAHLKSMWFASVSNSILWFAYFKAMYRSTVGRWLSGTIVFKVTAKGLQKLNNLPLRDVWMAFVWFIFSITTLIFGLVHFFKGQNWDTPLAISLIFMVYNLIPQYLLLQYAVFRPRMFFNAVCRLSMLISTAMAILGLALIWALYPRTYDLHSALGSSLYFMDTQRVGQLPDNFRVSWRQSSFLDESSAPVYLATNPNDTLLLGSLGSGSLGTDLSSLSADPFGGQLPGDSSGSGLDPFSPDPFSSTTGRRRRLQQDVSPFAAAADAAGFGNDPWATATGDGQGTDSAAAGGTDSAATNPPDPFAVADGGSTGASDPSSQDLFGTSAGDSATLDGSGSDATGAAVAAAPDPATAADPFAVGQSDSNPADSTGDLFAAPTPVDDGGTGSSDPFAAPVADGSTSPPDPFADSSGASATGGDPFAVPSTDSSGSADPFAAPADAATIAGAADPFAANDPFATPDTTSGLGSGDSFDPFATGLSDFGFDDQLELATKNTWDLTGGWISGMKAGNLKATGPIAFATALQSWAYMSFPDGFEKSGQTEALFDSVRWGADYLTKVFRYNTADNTSLLITRVGDVDTELLLWYRPEDSTEPRDAFAVDLNAKVGGYGADLGGSVAAGLASAATLFASAEDSKDKDYAATLLDSARTVYKASRSATLAYSRADYNMSLLYNSSTVYDDLAWAAGWMYKATKDETYLSDMYDFYVKHLQQEGEIADWKYAFDWDNVFWPLNVLMAQETGKGTFKDQSELFLKSWMCADNAAIYTRRGRAFNPMTASLGATANAGLLALMYADIAQAEGRGVAQTYQCWALSQLRYVLGDAGRSLVVGVGSNPPKRTQDRSAACPKPPAVCNRVTGLLSPDPDSYSLDGALVYGPGKSDNFLDIRNNDAAMVGIENNAGFIGALAGAVLLPSGMWEICLQEYGIYRSNPVCGKFVTL